ncbi:MAG TPA: nucleoside-diphosphate kinase [Candidatus Nanopusillus sp.]|nr:nucleoside-diphosphate kinase [Candidatus Nanopusillus sp.]HIP90312.1 nucleoside-diphosphate kinase [Candidatus Nanopusillus sp.]
MKKHPLIQRTLVILKPDSVKRGLIGEIISRFEKAGLKIVALKMLWFNKEMAERFYNFDRDWYERVGAMLIERYKEEGLDPLEEFGTTDAISIGKKVKEWLIEYITSGPVVAVVLEGVNAVEVIRKLVGPTEPMSAPAGTIRGDYSHMSFAYANWNKMSVRNVVHASDSEENANREISIVFKPEEIYEYRRDIEEVIY